VVQLDESQRWVVDRTVRDVCEHRRRKLHAVHVRTTHVHVLVTAPDPADKVLVDLKAWATRRMREAGVLGAETRAWSHHGSTKYINTAESLEGAIRYVLHEQGEVLPMTPPPE
jgi:REP element-mobilizing transposase RayT